jgi:cell division protein FtsL
MVYIDKANLGGDFSKLQDLDELPKIKRKKLLSLPDKIFMASIVLTALVVVLLVVVAVLALKINSLNKEVTALSKPGKQLEARHTEYDKLDARIRELEEAAKTATDRGVHETKRPEKETSPIRNINLLCGITSRASTVIFSPWFAKRSCDLNLSDPAVYTITVPNESVMACFRDRNEVEYLLRLPLVDCTYHIALLR